MLRFITGLFSRRPPSNFAPGDTIDWCSVSIPSGVKVILIGFSYDRPTIETNEWIRSALDCDDHSESIERFHDDTVTRNDLQPYLRLENRIEIFCGHGCDDGLYGPPFKLLSPDLLDEHHSLFYDQSMVVEGNGSLFAFACYAGGNFGRSYASILGNSFMGFSGKLPFANFLYPELRMVFNNLIQRVVTDGKVREEHRDLFHSILDSFIDNRNRYIATDLAGAYLFEYKRLFMIQCDTSEG